MEKCQKHKRTSHTSEPKVSCDRAFARQRRFLKKQKWFDQPHEILISIVSASNESLRRACMHTCVSALLDVPLTGDQTITGLLFRTSTISRLKLIRGYFLHLLIKKDSCQLLAISIPSPIFDCRVQKDLECMGGENRHYSMHTSLFFYVGNFILFCKLCHYIMQIVI